MARRTGSNVIGDLSELRVAALMLDHGIAVNALTMSDTGWDLHCHVPEDLIRGASDSGSSSWNLSGRTAHIQVKSAARDNLRVGTVRGWIMGTACGVPTFMFGTLHGQTVFSAPSDLKEWLDTVSRRADDGDEHRYVYEGDMTAKQTRLATHHYDKSRYPSVLQLWVRYPQIAMAFPRLTDWMNHDSADDDPRADVVHNLAAAIWADARYGGHTTSDTFRSSLAGLYRAAGFTDDEERAENHLKTGVLSERTIGDGMHTRDAVDSSIARFVDNQDPRRSAIALLEDLEGLHSTDATVPGRA